MSSRTLLPLSAVAFTLTACAVTSSEGASDDAGLRRGVLREVCDGLDNDGNGVADDGLPGCDVCAPYNELPVLTHYSAAVDGFDPAGTDVPNLLAPFDGKPYTPGACQPFWAGGRMPDFERYIGDTWATAGVSDADANAFLRGQCEKNKVPFRLLRADASVRSRLRSKPGAVQVVHSAVIDGSLATIVLPPNWSTAAPPGGYPIVANGFYDQNDNVFRSVGPLMMPLVARSGTEGRTGAIGVIWNAGGTHVTRSAHPRLQEQFAAVMDYARQFGGDPDRVLMFGGSRGGGTALMVASNPRGLPYRVRFAAVAAPLVRLGEHTTLQSTTYPGVLASVAYSVGLHDAWHTGWRYPACAGRPHLTGKTAPEAHLYVLTGTTDPDTADRTVSPFADALVAGLVRAGTQVHFETGSHDSIIPYGEQVEYAAKIARAGVPLEAEVLLRAGHFGRPLEERTWEALQAYVDPARAGQHPTVRPGITYYRVNREAGALEPFTPDGGVFPVTMDAARWVARGTRFPVMVTGPEGTDWELTITGPATPAYQWSGRVPAAMKAVQWIDVPLDQPTGDYVYHLRIRKPGAAGDVWKEIASSGTPDGSTPLLTVVAGEPDVSGDQVASSLRAPGVPAFGATHWGLSEY